VLERLRGESLYLLVALLGVALLAWLGLQEFAFSDYDTEVSAAFRALIAGDYSSFVAQLPSYGGSAILRSPLAAAVAALGGGELAVYRAVSIPGVLALAFLAVVLARRMGALGATRGTRILVVALCACNPIALRALILGHPEELMCAAFAIGAILAATRERPLLAGALLGLAIGSKAWAVLAIGPVLLALPHRRLAALGLAGAIAALLMAPLLFGGAAQQAAAGARTTGIIFNPWQIWWPLGHVVDVGYDGLPKPGARYGPGWLSPLSHPLIAALVVPLSLAWWHRRRREVVAGEQLLLLLALLLLARCILDPWNNVYYQLPFLISLLAWEALTRTWQPPVLTLAATIATWVTFYTLGDLHPNLLCAIYLAWALPLALWIARTCFLASSQSKATYPGASPERPLPGAGASDIALRRGR
jgi:alpha-1,6-mannosyltransferase